MSTFQLLALAFAALTFLGPSAKTLVARLPQLLRRTAADTILAPSTVESTDYVTVEEVMRIATWAKDRGLDDVAAALAAVPAKCFVCPEVAREVAE